MREVWRLSYVKEVWGRRKETEHCKRPVGVASSTDAAIVAELRVSLPRYNFRHNNRVLRSSFRVEGRDRPAMVAVAAIEGGHQQAGVGQRTQRPYTVSSIVSERSAGPSITPANARRRSICFSSAANPISTRRAIRLLWLVPLLRAAARTWLSRVRGSVMFFRTCVAMVRMNTHSSAGATHRYERSGDIRT